MVGEVASSNLVVPTISPDQNENLNASWITLGLVLIAVIVPNADGVVEYVLSGPAKFG